MAHKALLIALGMVLAASPAPAAVHQPDPVVGAPAGTADTKYCLRVEFTGTRIDKVKCWTREEWAWNGVDVDAEWAEEGVAIIVDGIWRPVDG